MKFGLRVFVFLVFVSAAFVGLKGQDVVRATDFSQDLFQSGNSYFLAVTSDAKGRYYAIDAADSTTIFRIKNSRVKRIVEPRKLSQKVRFNSLMVDENNRLLIGSDNQFVYSYKRGRINQFDFRNGLTDSVVNNIGKVQPSGLIVVNTPSKRFVYEGHRNSRKVMFRDMRNKADSSLIVIEPTFMELIQEPLNKAVCFLFADVDYSFKRQKDIKNKEIKEIKGSLLPGDILIKRNDYQLSNIGIPGFWSHSGIYLGGLSEMDDFFAGIEFLNGQKASEYIKKNHLNVFKQLNNKRHQIIEAIGEGVLINPVEHIAKVDYFAAMRTNLSRNDIFKSLLESFSYLNYPYDYMFDFTNDNELVCSELVYLSFRASNTKQGVYFEMSKRLGQPFMSPNDMAIQCANELAMPIPNLKLILFCGATHNEKEAEFKTPQQFAETVISNSFSAKLLPF